MNEATETPKRDALAGSDEGAGYASLPPCGHPLYQLGALLAHHLDDDKFNNFEPLLLAAWQEIAELRAAIRTARAAMRQSEAPFYEGMKALNGADTADA